MEYITKAVELHRNFPVADAHLDLAGEIYNRNMNGEKEIIKRYYLDNFKKAGINLIVSSLYIDNMFLPEMGLRIALCQINALIEDVETVKNDVTIVKTKKELNDAIKDKKIAIIISFEGLDPIGNDINLLRPFFELGVRGAGLTWSRRNYVADGSKNWIKSENKGRSGGLTDFGVEVVRKMEALGMFIDVSHLNDESFQDVMEFTTKPVIASHSNSRAINDHLRNLTDEQMIHIAKRGGVIGINAYKNIAGVKDFDNPILKLCDHLEYMIGLVGSEHVGYGFDLCDSYYLSELKFNFNKQHDDSLRNHSEAVLVTEELLKRGLNQEEVKLIIGGNFVRYFNEMLR